MYSLGHAAISLVLGVAIAFAVPAPVHPALVVAVALVVGVGIDFDHFPLAFLNTGTLEPIRRVRRRPAILFVDQKAIFDDELTHTQRLLSHAVIGGVAVGGLWFVSRYWAGVVGVTIYGHVLADLVADVRKERTLADGVADEDGA